MFLEEMGRSKTNKLQLVRSLFCHGNHKQNKRKMAPLLLNPNKRSPMTHILLQFDSTVLTLPLLISLCPLFSCNSLPLISPDSMADIVTPSDFKMLPNMHYLCLP